MFIKITEYSNAVFVPSHAALARRPCRHNRTVMKQTEKLNSQSPAPVALLMTESAGAALKVQLLVLVDYCTALLPDTCTTRFDLLRSRSARHSDVTSAVYCLLQFVVLKLG
jgi:hypothetical protein